MNETLILISLLFLKHFVVDFPLQKPYQWMNKGTYGHPGGILHAVLHGLFTMLCFWWYAPLACIWLGLMDAVVHYHVDWAKMNINKKYGWKADTHEAFWILLGADQLAHAATYVWLVSLVTV
jgi:hypothetical protein